MAVGSIYDDEHGGLEVYETVQEDTELETPPNSEPKNEEIETEAASHETALMHFLETPSRINETLLEKVERVRLEVDEIRKMGGVAEFEELTQELKNALKRKTLRANPDATTEVKPLVAQPDLFVSPADFQRLEARLAAIEKQLGASARVPSLAISVAESIHSIQNVLNLLASDPVYLESRINKLAEMEPLKTDTQMDQLNWVFSRLKTLDEEIRLLPHFISRLQTLRGVHTDLVATTNLVKETDRVMSVIHDEIKDWKLTLAALENKIDAYMRH